MSSSLPRTLSNIIIIIRRSDRYTTVWIPPISWPILLHHADHKNSWLENIELKNNIIFDTLTNLKKNLKSTDKTTLYSTPRPLYSQP